MFSRVNNFGISPAPRPKNRFDVLHETKDTASKAGNIACILLESFTAGLQHLRFDGRATLVKVDPAEHQVRKDSFSLEFLRFDRRCLP